MAYPTDRVLARLVAVDFNFDAFASFTKAGKLDSSLNRLNWLLWRAASAA